VTVGEAAARSTTPGRKGRKPEPDPVLLSRRGGPAERFAGAVGDRHPIVVFLLAVLSGFLLLAVASVLLALLIVHGLASDGGLGLNDTDSSPIEFLAEHRTGTLNTISEIGTEAGGAPVLPIVVGLIGIGFAIARRWAIAAFAVFVLTVESATYKLTSTLVPRDRPAVPRLEDLPADASYPSGHTAAAVAVYAGLVLLLSARLTGSLRKALCWTGVVLMVSFVALSRMYRGMHHPLDVLGGALLGVGAILVLLFACRAAEAAAERRRS